MIFQVVVLLYVGFTCWRTIVDWRNRRISSRFFGLILATHLPLVAVTVQPDLTTAVANTVGIGRGVDFLIYCAVLVMLRCLLALYRWNTQLESEITLLVRNQALNESHPAESATTTSL
jgi:small membrane protein